MAKVAIVETKRSRNDYYDLFDNEFDFDLYQLCSNPGVKKVLVRDVDIDIDPAEYDKVILVGADAFKYFTKKTSVTEYSGKLVEEKFLPIINPAMLGFKPEMKRTWERSKDNVIGFVNGTKKQVSIKGRGIQDTDEISQYLDEALRHPSPYFAIDTETSGLYPRDGYVLGISMCYDNENGVYMDADYFDDVCEFKLQELFRTKTPIFHNAKFDIAMIEYHFGIKIYNFEDTMLLHYLINEIPGTHGLKQQAMDFTDYGDYEAEMYKYMDDQIKARGIRKADFTWDMIPFEIMKDYASIDALVTSQIFFKFIKIKENKKLASVYDNILIPGTRFLTNVQDYGVPFDKERLVKAQALMDVEIQEAVNELYSHPVIGDFEAAQGKEFNPNSVMQLRSLLFDFIGLDPIKRTEKGAPSTDAEVLEKLSKQSPIPKLILAIRQKNKIKNTYLSKIIPQLDKDGRLRTGFNLHTTTSGRLSSSGKLNMQQLPRDNPIVKGCIKARPGYKIVAMDLTTAEMYIAAVLSGDKVLQDVFKSGGDFHSTIAHQVFGLPCAVEEVKDMYSMERQSAKAISFGILYGASAMRVSDEVTKATGTPYSVQEAQEAIDDYFRRFKDLKKWIEKNQNFIKANGFIYSYFGRKRRLPNVQSSDQGIVGHEIRSGLNFLVQSVASDINLLGGIDMEVWMRNEMPDSGIFALVHDSILAEVKEEDVDRYIEKLQEFIQLDRGMNIKGCPVGCDFDVADDYSLGKFEKMYEQIAA